MSKERDDRINPNNKICNPPTYQIHGKERREYKKKLSGLKYFIKSFWGEHQMERDMAAIYGDLKELLDRPYLPKFREERLKKLLDE